MYTLGDGRIILGLTLCNLSQKYFININQYVDNYRFENLSKILGLFSTKYIIVHEDADPGLYGSESPRVPNRFWLNNRVLL